MKTADTPEEWRNLLDSDEIDIVRTRADWDRMIADGERRRSMFNNCPPEAVEAFTNSLEFRKGGLAHGDYAPLMEFVTLKQFNTIMNSFGIGDKLATDYRDRKCDPPSGGTCEIHLTSICTSNC